MSFTRVRINNPWITAKARKLLQRLTADRTELVYNSERDVWMIKGAYVTPGPCREILHLCLLTTTLRNPPNVHYVLTREARKLLIDPHLKPAFLCTTCRQ